MSETKIITYETKDYDLFKKIDGNRTVSETNVKAIVANVIKNGLKPTIIIVNEKMEIIDGQHRVEALKELNLPVYYQVWEGLGVKDCIALNVVTRTWKSEDFVESYARAEGYEVYKELVTLRGHYPEFTYDTIVSVINNVSSGNNITGPIREGKLKLRLSFTESIEKLNHVKEIYETISNVKGKLTILISVISRLIDLECVDVDRLKTQLNMYGDNIKSVNDSVDALNKIQEVYNQNKHTKVRFVDAYLTKYVDKNE